MGYWGGQAALSLLALFGVVLVALHWMAAVTDEIPHYISHFRLFPFAWLWIAGLLLFAAGGLSLVISLHGSLPKGGWSKASLACLWPVPPLAVALAVFPAAAPGAVTTWVGRVHEVAAIAMFLLLGLAMMCLFPALRWGWRFIAWSSLLLGLAFFGLTPWMIRGFVTGDPDVFYSERIVALIHGVWLFQMGMWSRGETAPFVLASRLRRRVPTRANAQ